MDFTSAINLMGAIIVTLGGSTVVVFGLSSWLGKIWADRLMEKEKAKYTQEIEKLKHELETKIIKIEHFHQVSESTYQELFKKKIEVYNKLLHEKIEYFKIIHEDAGFELQDYPLEVYHNFYSKTKSIINDFRLFISNELSDKYDELYFKTSPYIVKLGIEEYYVEMSQLSSEEAHYALDSKQQSIYREMITDTSKEMEAFLNQIDEDVKQLKKKMEFI